MIEWQTRIFSLRTLSPKTSSELRILDPALRLEDLQADSLDIVDLVMGIEELFDIHIPDEHAERILTVQNALDYIVEYT